MEDIEGIGRYGCLPLELPNMPKLRPWRLVLAAAAVEEEHSGPMAGGAMPCPEVDEPVISMLAAAAVVQAMVVADKGRGWLWVPS